MGFDRCPPRKSSKSPDLDPENHAIRVISPKTGKIRSLIGNGQQGDGPDGDPAKCQLHQPHGIHIAKDGAIYIGDSSNNKLRKLISE